MPSGFLLPHIHINEYSPLSCLYAVTGIQNKETRAFVCRYSGCMTKDILDILCVYRYQRALPSVSSMDISLQSRIIDTVVCMYLKDSIYNTTFVSYSPFLFFLNSYYIAAIYLVVGV